MKIRVGARSSPLSRAQFEEICTELQPHSPHIHLEPVWADTPGDRDKQTSLRNLGKTDFFTKDLDCMLLAGTIRIAIHSAKDLPDPIPEGLELVALTRGVDPRDSLLLREGETIETLPQGARIAASSARREEIVKTLRADLNYVDLRGTIGERIAKLESGEVDGIVIAEAALIRLKLKHRNRMILPGETTPLQGRLAILARKGDEEIKRLFKSINFISELIRRQESFIIQ